MAASQDDLPAPDQRLAAEYRLCPRCWRSLAPVRRCTCAPPPAEGADDGAHDGAPARLVADYPALQQLADAVERGRYADDRATIEERRRAFAQWLVEHDRVSEWGERDRIDRDE